MKQFSPLCAEPPSSRETPLGRTRCHPSRLGPHCTSYTGSVVQTQRLGTRCSPAPSFRLYRQRANPCSMSARKVNPVRILLRTWGIAACKVTLFVVVLGSVVISAANPIWRWDERPFTDPYAAWIRQEVLSEVAAVPSDFNPDKPELRALYANALKTKGSVSRIGSEEEIKTGFSTVGPQEGRQKEFLDHVEGLAEYFYASNDREAGRKVAHILLGFQRVAGEWPVTSRTDLPPYSLKDKRAPNSGNWAGRIWSDWFYTDVPLVARLARAYDYLLGTQTGRDVLAEVADELGVDDPVTTMDDFFVYWWRVLTEHWAPMWTNMEPQRILGMIDLAQAMGKPTWVRQAIRWVDRIVYRGFYRDGMWHEATPSYALMVTNRLPRLIDRLQGYTDPVGYVDPVEGNRIENLDAQSRWGAFSALTSKAVDSLVLPNSRYLAINDSHSTQQGPKPSKSVPSLLPAAGIATLGSGEGKDQFQLHLTFTSPDGHEHLDALGVVLWAHGTELLSDGEYHGNRPWQSSTAAHNTVVVDEKNQFSRFQGRQVSIDWGKGTGSTDDWQNYHASNGNRAELMLYDVKTPGIMVAKAAADALYPAEVSRYERLVVAVERPIGSPYIVDIFWVDGGHVHDWMIHGPLGQEYSLDVDIDLKRRSGSYHQWISQLESGRTVEDVHYRIYPSDGVSGIEGWLLSDETPTEVIVGMGPAMRRAGEAPFAGLRRLGPTNVFVVIHNPYESEPLPLHFEALPIVGQPENVVAIEVSGPGFSDVLIATPDGPVQYPSYVVDSHQISFSGSLGWLRREGGVVRNALVIGGGHMKTPRLALTSPADVTGRVMAIGRAGGKVGRSGPADENTLQHFIEVDAYFPPGKQLSNEILALVFGDGSRHAVRIDYVEPIDGDDDRSRVYLIDDPGVEHSETGVDMVFFPNWFVEGPVTFELLGRADSSSLPHAPGLEGQSKLEPMTGMISGTVRDLTGQPVEGAVVQIVGYASGPALTDATGHFQFSQAPTGRQWLTATHALYAAASFTGAHIADDEESMVTVTIGERLPPQLSGVSSQVESGEPIQLTSSVDATVYLLEGPTTAKIPSVETVRAKAVTRVTVLAGQPASLPTKEESHGPHVLYAIGAEGRISAGTSVYVENQEELDELWKVFDTWQW